MTDLDRTSIDRLLPAAAGMADWDDVLSRAGAGQGRRRALVALAVLAAVAVMAASALAVRAFLIDKGYIGLPPVGATPSTPKRGKLVLELVGRNSADPGLIAAYVYADGRLIWRREGNLPHGANSLSTGWLEQHLTPAGVQRMQSEMLATGLFDRDIQLRSSTGLIWGWVRVRRGARLVRVGWSGCCGNWGGRLASAEQERALSRVDALLVHPRSWLPASAWRDPKVRAYVPSGFDVYYGPWLSEVAHSAVMRHLPRPARAILRGKRVTGVRGDVGSPANPVPAYYYRFRIGTEKARLLSAELASAGLALDRRADAYLLAYRVRARDTHGVAVSIEFEPVLPHGGFTCSACG